MKNLFNLFVTICVVFTISSCSTYRYELGTMSTRDQAEKLAVLNQQEKQQLKSMEMHWEVSKDSSLLSNSDPYSLITINVARDQIVESMSEENQKRDIRVKSYDGYEAAYFYQVVNTGGGQAFTEEDSQMNLLLMNKTRKRPSYSSTDPYSVTAKIYLVKPKEAKPGFSLEHAQVIRQVGAVRLSAEDKEIIKLPIGFYKVDFIYNNEVVYSGPVTLNPLHTVSVSSEDVRGTNANVDDIDGCAFVNL
jgi:hypothetical protein